MSSAQQIHGRIALYLEQIRSIQVDEREAWRKRMAEDVIRNMGPEQARAYIEGEKFRSLDDLITKPLRSHAFGFARYRLDRMSEGT